jgi:hypothetical protein
MTRQASQRSDSAILAIVIMLIVGLIAAYGLLLQNRTTLNLNPYDTAGTGSKGLSVLQRWLTIRGYEPVAVRDSLTDVSASLDALFILPGGRTLTEEEADALMVWAANGKLLVIGVEAPAARLPDDTAPTFSQRDALLETIGVSVEDAVFYSGPTLVQPVFADRNGVLDITSRNYTLYTERSDAVVLMMRGSDIEMLGLPQGAGDIFVTGEPELFTNGTLRNGQDGKQAIAIINGMLQRLPKNARIGIDATRLDVSTATGVSNSAPESSFWAQVYTQPWGWATLFALALILTTLAMNGRRFGRAMPLPQELVRRSPAEYAHSMARLFRRADKREAMLAHYRRQLKRQLGRPSGVSSDLPDAQFVAELKRVRDDIDEGALLGALRSLENSASGTVSESDLVRRVNAAQKFTRPEG